ncbi:MAG: 7,8-didemethyl-8-hydroxy-5-deazariboflavin synthase subunit 1 / 7,8-didemethyl-8-hydroxy-5-deazariboflavin synthase subunit 2, partial [uncultured Rubrobacteraceae bacterium]
AQDARGRTHSAPRPHRQRAGLVGEARGRGRQGVPAGRLQRPRRHADEREHQPGRRGRPRAGDDACGPRGHDPGDRPNSPPPQHPLRRPGEDVLGRL